MAALVTSVGLLGGAAWIASGTTGAYFSETRTGSVTGTIGSIHVTTSGGIGNDNADVAFTDLLPGQPQTVTLKYSNSGSSPEDVYVVFNNPTALSALNNLGTYGEVHLAANGNALFDSANLNDRASTCGAFAPTGCWPLKSQYLVARNVPAGAGGNVKFTFQYASKLKSQPAAGTTAAWNQYPVSGQTTTNAADGTGSGLPLQVVATQPGVTPGS
ncbi:hypothetical protein [Amnibacterium sp.]|uniref:hypothetical protein n=1 Tax=Amnibacterium sp. TaxID=1872496 RepID=UPI003F7C1446